MIEVVHVVPSVVLSTGGTATVVRQLHAELLKASVCSRVLTQATEITVSPDEPQIDVTPLGEVWRRLNSAKERSGSTGRSLVIHLHGLWHPYVALAAMWARFNRARTIVSVHGMLLEAARGRRRVKKDIAWRLYQRRILRDASCVHVTSADELQSLKMHRLVGKVELLRFGLKGTNVAVGKPSRVGQGRMTRRLVFVGRLHPIKNLEAAISAFARADLPYWEFDLIGPGDPGYLEALAQLIEREGVADRVCLLGPLYGVERDCRLANGHLFILPSLSENFGAALGEALLAGLPVLASKGVPWPEIDSEGLGAWVESTAEGLESGLTYLGRLPEAKLDAMGRRARSFALHNLLWSAVIEDFVAMYESTLIESSAGASGAVC